MASTSGTTYFAEGAFPDRPPILDGTDFKFWKMRMLNFLLAYDVSGYKEIMGGQKSSVNSNALKLLYEALDENMIDRIPKFTYAIELWKYLEMQNEGNNELIECHVVPNDEICNLALTIIENPKGESENENAVIWDTEISDCDEMLAMLNDLNDRYNALKKKCNLIKKEHTLLQHEHALCMDKIRALDNDDICLKSKYENDMLIDQYEHALLIEQIHALDDDDLCLNEKHENCVESMKNEASISISSCACESLKIKNDELNKKIDDLNCIVTKFTQGEKNFKMLLGSQKNIFGKCGLGYKPHMKQKYLTNYFVKASQSHTHSSYVHASNIIDSNIKCHACNMKGHMSFNCWTKKKNVTLVWVHKGTKTNPHGPKKIWVPKYT